jgi:hypothetical protein
MIVREANYRIVKSQIMKSPPSGDKLILEGCVVITQLPAPYERAAYTKNRVSVAVQ